MKNNYVTTLDSIMNTAKDPLTICKEYCNKMITKKTKDPITMVLKVYDLYVKMKEASEIYRLINSGNNKSTFETLSFINFYKCLPSSVKDSMVNKLPEME